MSVATVNVRGLPYGIETGGREGAPVVLLIHGFAGSGRDWGTIATALHDAGYWTIAVDLPGHGRSFTAASPERFGFASTALDLVAILDHAGVARAHVAGYSMGGRLALGAALAHPDRFESLALEGTSPGIEDPTERVERVRADEALADSIEARGAAWFAETWATQPIFASQRSLPDAVRAEQDARRRENDPSGLASSLRAAGQGAQPYVGDRLGAFAKPVLLIAGSLDTKYVSLAATMAARFPAARQATAPDAGHNVHLEQPGWFARTLLAHVDPAAAAAPHEAATR